MQYLFFHLCLGWFSLFQLLKSHPWRLSQTFWLRIILKTLQVYRLEALENLSHGKITLINASSQMIRVHLSPTVTWSHFERRTNETLRANPDRRIGSNRVPWVDTTSWSLYQYCYNQGVSYALTDNTTDIIKRSINSKMNRVISTKNQLLSVGYD